MCAHESATAAAAVDCCEHRASTTHERRGERQERGSEAIANTDSVVNDDAVQTAVYSALGRLVSGGDGGGNLSAASRTFEMRLTKMRAKAPQQSVAMESIGQINSGVRLFGGSLR